MSFCSSFFCVWCLLCQCYLHAYRLGVCYCHQCSNKLRRACYVILNLNSNTCWWYLLVHFTQSYFPYSTVSVQHIFCLSCELTAWKIATVHRFNRSAWVLCLCKHAYRCNSDWIGWYLCFIWFITLRKQYINSLYVLNC